MHWVYMLSNTFERSFILMVVCSSAGSLEHVFSFDISCANKFCGEKAMKKSNFTFSLFFFPLKQVIYM